MLVVIPRSGISGDMLLSALIEICADEKKIARFLKKELSVSVRTEKTVRFDVRARRLVVDAPEKHYSPEEMREVIEKSELPNEAKSVSLRVLETLVRAEQRIHCSKTVHFHELSHVDTLVDIMGCALALWIIGEREIYTLPVNVGRIAPATLEILTCAHMPFYSTTDSIELTTPTGAALITNIAKPVSGIPAIVSEKVGYGAGTYEADDEPNVLRVIKGNEPDRHERIVMLETNLDDVSGEIIAYVAERLLTEGAKDACLIPIIAKKGRPGVILKVICERKDSERISHIIFEETGTLGIRESECMRHIASRSKIEKKGKNGKVRIKVGRIGGKVISSKPEFEDLKKIAKKKRKALMDVFRELGD